MASALFQYFKIAVILANFCAWKKDNVIAGTAIKDDEILFSYSFFCKKHSKKSKNKEFQSLCNAINLNWHAKDFVQEKNEKFDKARDQLTEAETIVEGDGFIEGRMLQ